MSSPLDLSAIEARPRLGGGSLLALGINGVVGVGIFFTPNVVAGLVPGISGALVYLATAALLLPVALTVSMLGQSLPVDGGPSVWARAAFGEITGYAVGWIAAVSALISTAAVLLGVGTHVAAAFGYSDPGSSLIVACCTIVVLGSIAALGLRPSAWTWSTLTLLKLMPLGLLILIFVFATPVEIPKTQAVAEPEYGRALLVALFPLQGFEVVPVLAGSVGRGRAVLPFATLGALIFAALLYAALQLACVTALPDLASQRAPLVAAAGALGGDVFARVVAIGTNVSAVGVAFGMMVMTPRYLSVLGTEAGLGAWLGRLDGRGVPRRALAVTVVSVFALVFSMKTVALLLVLSSAAVLVQYVAAQASLLRLAAERRNNLSTTAAIPALLGFGAVFLLAKGLSIRELAILGGALASGGLLWVLRRIAVVRAMTRGSQ